MYRPDTSIDYTIAFGIFCFLLPCLAFILFRLGRQQADRRLTVAGFVSIGAFVVSTIIFAVIQIVGVPEKDKKSQQQDMATTIQTKYNDKYYPDYLRQVEFAQSAAEGESGDFFTLTYNDYETETRRFYFDVSGNPTCHCTLYQPAR